MTTDASTTLDADAPKGPSTDAMPDGPTGTSKRSNRAAAEQAGMTAVAKVGWYVLLTSISVVVLFPIYMLLVRALSSGASTLFRAEPSLTPVDADWGVFGKAFSSLEMGRPMLQSLVVTVVIVVAQTLTSTMAAYAFAFLEFPLKKVMFALVIGTMLLPIEVTLIANIQTMFDFQLISVTDSSYMKTLAALTVPFLSSALGVFLIRQGFMGIPHDLLDAARLDGYSDWRFLWKVAVPVAKPVVASFVVVSFLGAYNQYVWPRFAVKNFDYQTVQVALRSFLTENPNELNYGFAAAIIAALPVLVLLLVFQRQLVRGLTAGAVK